MLTPDWIVFVEQYPRFLQVYRKIAQTDWFQERGWTAFVGHYPLGIFLQLSKPHWYNYTFDGIHIPFTATTFAPRVSAALTQICRLDEVIDEALVSLWP